MRYKRTTPSSSRIPAEACLQAGRYIPLRDITALGKEAPLAFTTNFYYSSNPAMKWWLKNNPIPNFKSLPIRTNFRNFSNNLVPENERTGSIWRKVRASSCRNRG
jgi:hypothetical protein